MSKVLEYIQDNMFDDPTFFTATKMDKPDDDKVLFVVKQLKAEKDLAYKIIDSKGKKNVFKR